MEAHGCRICSGPLEPFHRGRGGGPAPADFAPSNHRPGEHGPLVRCRDCGAVQQPGLPSGARAPRPLPRDVGRGVPRRGAGSPRDRAAGAPDDRAPRAGRAAPRRRLRSRAAARRGAPHGLRSAGAGALTHGRRLRARRARARGARGAGRGVRGEPAERVRRGGPRGRDRAPRGPRVRAGGVCRAAGGRRGALRITPDPSAPLARLAGERWWGYVPAHTCLLPARTLRELLAARGLDHRRRRWARPLVRAALLDGRALRAWRTRRGAAAQRRGHAARAPNRLALARRRADGRRAADQCRAPGATARERPWRVDARHRRPAGVSAQRARSPPSPRRCRSTPSIVHCWSTTRARTPRRRSPCARASSCCGCR